MLSLAVFVIDTPNSGLQLVSLHADGLLLQAQFVDCDRMLRSLVNQPCDFLSEGCQLIQSLVLQLTHLFLKLLLCHDRKYFKLIE